MKPHTPWGFVGKGTDAGSNPLLFNSISCCLMLFSCSVTLLLPFKALVLSSNVGDRVCDIQDSG